MSAPKNQKINVGPGLRQARKNLSLTLKELSEKCGLSVPFISQVERGRTIPSLMSLFQLSEALEIDMNQIIKATQSWKTVRRGDDPEYLEIDSDAVHVRLANPFPDQKLDPLYITYPSGYESRTDKGEGHEGEAFLYVLEGQLRVEYSGEVYQLKAGDSMHYDLRETLRLFNRGSEDARCIWVGSLVLG
ncbi:helix-turn-helix domain-containing protein [Kordiimonas lipolytica]|uniref:Helix-turn-helix domain-containing protein n=1 Tax=Kordiimonas lipolytica TaxID=1662421 RepID=A0ABV8UFH4_9PROT|nr:cupin domain-containing protein [Kordiimonas lipolytica]